MIVRNESAILERCLLSVRPHVDCYFICDTGSTDDTVDIIKRTFKGLPGEVRFTDFRDFGQARNEALDGVRESSLEFDYLILIDADMELVVEDLHWREKLSHPAYTLRQTSGSLSYHNVRLLAKDAQARYVGSTHEYVELEIRAKQLDGVWMLDHACGSNRKEKTERDLALLTSSLEFDPQDARSLFYLAQTLREADRHEEAIEAYERRICLGGWDEELWYSRYMIARCYQAQGDFPRFLAGCLEAYDMRPSRAEPLHAMAQHYRLQGRNEACAMLCEVGLRIPRPDDLLFVSEDVYHTGFRQELSICGYYSPFPERKGLARRFCRELAVDPGASRSVRENARSNWPHYARSVSEHFGMVRLVALEHPLPQGYYPCNPSVAERNGKIWCVLRSVNYRLENNHYLSDEGVIHTQNYLCQLDDALQIISSVPIMEEKSDPNRSTIVEGLEDIRLLVAGTALRASATVVDGGPDCRRQMAIFDLTYDGRVERLTVQEHGSDQHQKNWVPFVKGEQIGFVFWTDPTTILRWNEKTRQCEHWLERACPAALENQRGSSGAIPFDDGWLYVSHEVSYSGGVRTYLHRFIHLDADFQCLAATEPFYFRTLGVEFCCGLSNGPEDGQVLVSFGVQDREAWLVVLEADQVRLRLHPLAWDNRVS